MSLDRREFLKSASAIAACSVLGAGSVFGTAKKPQIAITMDDPQTAESAGMSWEEINRRILQHLGKNGAPAALFVCGKRVDSPEGKKLLESWNSAGHLLGNHSYSHLYLNSEKVTLDQFCEDITKGEKVVSGYSQFTKSFRYPFFKEGDTLEKRDGVRKFLAANGYSLGRATIDASDWAINGRLVKRDAQDPKADLKPYRDFYLQHMWERASFYDDLSLKVLGARPAHTVLIHHSALNALFLGDLLQMFESRGWEWISAERAYADPVYRRRPNILPAGESLIWALAKETGKYDAVLRYPGEDDTYENPKMDKLGL